MTIGINTGDILVDSDHIAGDVVNTAQRIQAEAEPDSVVVGPETRRAAGPRIAFAPQGRASVRGLRHLVLGEPGAGSEQPRRWALDDSPGLALAGCAPVFLISSGGRVPRAGESRILSEQNALDADGVTRIRHYDYYGASKSYRLMSIQDEVDGVLQVGLGPLHTPNRRMQFGARCVNRRRSARQLDRSVA